MLAPVLALGVVRHFAFAGSTSAMYAIPRQPRELVLLVMKGILQWPTGIVGPEGAKKIFEHLSLSGSESDAMLLVANVLLWLTLLAIGWWVLRPGDSAPAQARVYTSRFIPLAIWTFGALCFGILGPKPSYGVAIYPFEILLFAVTCHFAVSPRLRNAAGLALIVLAAAFTWQFQSRIRNIDWDAWHTMQELVSALRSHDGPGKTIYVLNSTPSYSSPSFIARFAGTKAGLVILNEADGCRYANDGNTTFKAEGNRITAKARIPACASITFSSVHTPRLTAALKGTLQRGSFAEYSFPDGRIASLAVRSGEPIIDFGKEIDISLTPDNQSSLAILYYDWRLGRFECFGSGCAS
jgi:hypothetical protein